uniref:Folliculin-interacting protein 1 n=1 Tax=Mesocestoides corti TaxID=53468 RepID=A0A5K3FGJ7_MESCO
TLGVLHLYIGKSHDDFAAAFASPNLAGGGGGCVPAATGPLLQSDAKVSSGSSGSSSLGNYAKPAVNMFHSLTARSNYYCNLPQSQSHSGYVSNPVTEMCNQADRAVVQDLEQATAAARSTNSPAPLDAVTGFETGCHLNGESNVMLLIGWKTVHAIAHQTVDEMFNWAEVLERCLIGEFRLALLMAQVESVLEVGSLSI